MLSANQCVDLAAPMHAFQLDSEGGDHLPPLHLPMVPWDELPETDRKQVKDLLRADQRRRDAEARRHGRDPLAEAISAHLAACARTGAQPLMTFGDLR